MVLRRNQLRMMAVTAVALGVTTMIVTTTTSWASAVSTSSHTASDSSTASFYTSYQTAENDYQAAINSAIALYGNTVLNNPSGPVTDFTNNLNTAHDTFVSAVTSHSNSSYSISISQSVSTVNGVTTETQTVSP